MPEPRTFNNEMDWIPVPRHGHVALPRNTHLVVSHHGDGEQTAVILADQLQVVLQGPADWTVRFEHGLGDLGELDDVIAAARGVDTDDDRFRALLAAAEKMRAVFGPAGIL